MAGWQSVMRRFAKPFTRRLKSTPPPPYRPDGEIGRHKGLKIPRIERFVPVRPRLRAPSRASPQRCAFSAHFLFPPPSLSPFSFSARSAFLLFSSLFFSSLLILFPFALLCVPLLFLLLRVFFWFCSVLASLIRLAARFCLFAWFRLRPLPRPFVGLSRPPGRFDLGGLGNRCAPAESCGQAAPGAPRA